MRSLSRTMNSDRKMMISRLATMPRLNRARSVSGPTSSSPRCPARPAVRARRPRRRPGSRDSGARVWIGARISGRRAWRLGSSPMKLAIEVARLPATSSTIQLQARRTARGRSTATTPTRGSFGKDALDRPTSGDEHERQQPGQQQDQQDVAEEDEDRARPGRAARSARTSVPENERSAQPAAAPTPGISICIAS